MSVPSLRMGYAMLPVSLSVPRLVVSIADVGTRLYELAYYREGVCIIKHLRGDMWSVAALAGELGCLVQLPAYSLNPDMYNRLSNLLVRSGIPTVGRGC